MWVLRVSVRGWDDFCFPLSASTYGGRLSAKVEVRTNCKIATKQGLMQFAAQVLGQYRRHFSEGTMDGTNQATTPLQRAVRRCLGPTDQSVRDFKYKVLMAVRWRCGRDKEPAEEMMAGV